MVLFHDSFIVVLNSSSIELVMLENSPTQVHTSVHSHLTSNENPMGYAGIPSIELK